MRNNVEFYEDRLQLALNKMDRMRCPMRMADDGLYDEMCDAVEDWCEDNDIDFYEIDLEELIEGIIWEE